jgi:hypothetical protein
MVEITLFQGQAEISGQAVLDVTRQYTLSNGQQGLLNHR